MQLRFEIETVLAEHHHTIPCKAGILICMQIQHAPEVRGNLELVMSLATANFLKNALTEAIEARQSSGVCTECKDSVSVFDLIEGICGACHNGIKFEEDQQMWQRHKRGLEE